MGLLNFFTEEIAIDLGTANTIIIHNDKVVVDEPSIVAEDRSTKKIIAVGRIAMQMHGKTHENIRTIRPLKDGVIADFHAAEQMIRGDLYPFWNYRSREKSRERFCRACGRQRSVSHPRAYGCGYWYRHRCGRTHG
jgi:actin-like ATPase involved in cell morphogenesis